MTTFNSEKYKGRWSEIESFYDYQLNKNNMIKKLVTSRTVWTFVVLFLINGVTGVQDLLPGNWLPAVNAVLGVLGIYFRLNTRV